MSASPGSRRGRFARGLLEGVAVAATGWLVYRLVRPDDDWPAAGTIFLAGGLVAALCGVSRAVTHGVVGGIAGLALGGLIGQEVVGRSVPNYRTGREHIVGQPARISGPTLGGGTFDIAQYKGKVVVVDFWATWCVPCLQEMPQIVQLYREYHAEGLEVVGVSHDKDETRLDKYVKNNDIPWPQVLFPLDPNTGDRPNPNAKSYGVDGIPYNMVVDREGTIVAERVRGESLRKAVEQALRNADRAPTDLTRHGMLALFAVLGWMAGAALEWSFRQPPEAPAAA